MFDDLEKELGVYPEVSREELKEFKQKEYNKKQKTLRKSVGENMASFGCILVVILFVGYIWTDMKIDIFSQRMLCDALVSVISFIVVEDLMSRNGINCGKLYDEYVNTYAEYIALKKRVIEAGITGLAEFCDDVIEKEHEAFVRKKCKDMRMDFDEYRSLAGKPREELKGLPKGKLAVVMALNQIKPIVLTPDLLLTDGTGESDSHRGVSISAKEYVKKSTKGWMNVTATVITCVFSASIAFFANAGASWGLVMYTVLKLALLCWRMYKGYSAGAKAYNTIEVKHLQDKMTYLHLYLESKNTIQQS